ncbi:MAG: NAD(P)H-dependent glycerol-3-phosphate dehydrogenase [Burkholderiaceae bacterium]
MRISIVGAGAWGTALALIAARRHEVTLHVRDAVQTAALRTSRENARYLPGFVLPAAVTITDDLMAAVADAELIVLATPLAGLRATSEALAPMRPRQVVCVCKGLEAETHLLPHQVIAEVLPGVPAAALSGPSFAVEVAAGLPVALTAASADEVLAERIVHTLHGGAVRVYRSSDVIGVEVGGAVKNVMAVAAGISDGLELGANARAALITRGLSEMMRYGVALGGSAETLIGLTGVGDLILTCTGGLSRNRRVGLGVGRGQPLDTVLAELGHVAEGVQCARPIRASAERLGVDMPITAAVAAILFEGLSPREALGNLLARAPRHEH